MLNSDYWTRIPENGLITTSPTYGSTKVMKKKEKKKKNISKPITPCFDDAQKSVLVEEIGKE